MPVNPELRLRALLLDVLVQSVQEGWIDINTYAYVSFMNSGAFDIDEVFEYLAEQAAAMGRLTTASLQRANEIFRAVRERRRQPKRKGWLSWLMG